MRVCLLNDSFPPIIDGVANTVMNYAGILTKEQLADVVVGTPRYPDVDYSVYPYRVIPYQSFDVNSLVEGYRVGNPMQIKSVAQLVDFQPDIIHTHCPAMSTYLARILRHDMDGAPVVFTYHTKFDVDIKKAIQSKLLQRETLKAIVSNISACDEVWVVSEGAGENLRSLGYEGDYRIMTNGVDFPKGRASEEEVLEATKGYDLPQDVPVFLFVGRLMKYKGLPIIVDALKLLHEKGQDFRMVFIGSGGDAEELEATVEAYGLRQKVFFTGPIRDRSVLRAWNTRASLFLFPSTYDTNGIVVREAAACGLASVLIDGSCASEGVTHGRNGYLIEENAASMAALLEQVSVNPSGMRQTGQHAMDEIYVSWNQSVRIAYDRYAEIIEEKKAGTLLNRKKQPADFALALSAEMMDGAQQIFQLPRNLHEGMMENIAELRDEIHGVREDFLRIRNNVRDNVVENLQKHLGE